ncbi:MAG: hypothetical protein WCH76_04180, partial [Candidatus Riflemargulisbacteria bacterium]
AQPFNGGYHFNVGMGTNFYTNSIMKAYDSEAASPAEYRIKYKDAIGYHFLVEAWSNMPKVWVFDDMNFVMSLRWNFGASFAAETTPFYADWNNIGLNGFMFNTAIAFLW